MSTTPVGRARGIGNYKGDATMRQLSFEKGQEMVVLARHDTGWLTVRLITAAGESQPGYVPSTWVEDIPMPPAPAAADDSGTANKSPRAPARPAGFNPTGNGGTGGAPTAPPRRSTVLEMMNQGTPGQLRTRSATSGPLMRQSTVSESPPGGGGAATPPPSLSATPGSMHVRRGLGTISGGNRRATLGSVPSAVVAPKPLPPSKPGIITNIILPDMNRTRQPFRPTMMMGHLLEHVCKRQNMDPRAHIFKGVGGTLMRGDLTMEQCGALELTVQAVRSRDIAIEFWGPYDAAQPAAVVAPRNAPAPARAAAPSTPVRASAPLQTVSAPVVATPPPVMPPRGQDPVPPPAVSPVGGALPAMPPRGSDPAPPPAVPPAGGAPPAMPPRDVGGAAPPPLPDR